MSLNRALRFISVISLWSLYVSLLTTHRHQKHGYRNQPCGLSSVFGKHSGQDCKNMRSTTLSCSTTEKQSSAEKDLNATDLMSWDIKSAPKLDFDEDYYNVLEVDSNIAGKELKKAYYSIVFIYHPDRKSEVAEKELANKQMMVINGAYRVLKLPETRLAYDIARKQGYVGANAGVKGSGKNPNSKSSRPPSAKYGGVYTPTRTASGGSGTKSGTYAGTGRRPKFVDENGNIDEELFNADKASRAGWEETYYKRRQTGSAYQGDEFARAAPPKQQQEYVGTVGRNSTSSNSNPGGPTAGADPLWDAKKAIAEQDAQIEKERLENGFIFITDDEEREKKREPSIWEEIVEKSQAEVDTFINDAYDQLSNTPMRGPLGEIGMMIRILLGNLIRKDKDEEY